MKYPNQMKRILSFALAIVMIFGMMPVFAHAAGNDQALDAVVVFSDLHTNKSDYKESTVKGIFGALKNTGLPFSSVTSAGDAFSVNEDSSSSNGPYTGDPTKITGYIRTALGNNSIPVNYVWSDHDRYATGIDKKSSLVEYENYYIYKLSMGDLCSYDRYKAGFNYTENNNTGRVNAGFTATVPQAIAEFEAAVKNLDKSKPLFIVSHQPLFDNRNDNAWAEHWFDSINAVAAEMDVAFFYGHNHKYDKASDYYYAKGSSMPVATMDKWGWKYEVGQGYKPSVDLSSENKILNFTHMCAGYMEPTSTGSYDNNTTRKGTVMVITIYEEAIRYTTYDKNGIYTGNYAVDKTVTRDHAVTEPELVVTGTDTYFVGEELDLTVSVKTGSKVENVTAQATLTGYNMNTAGAYTVTASYNGMTAQFPINVYQKTFAASGVTVEVTKPGATALTVTSATADAEPMLMNYVGYNINLTGYTQGDGAVVTLPVPAGVTKPAVCHVADGKIVKVNATVSGNTVSFSTDVFGTFLVGQEGISENLEQSVTAGGTSYEEKTVFAKADSFENGGKYLLVGEDKATNGNKIAYVNNNGSEGWVVVTPNAEDQIELDNAGAVWTASGDAAKGFTLTNNNKYIGGTDAKTLKGSAGEAVKVTYDAKAARLKTASGTTRYLYYSTYGSENWKWSTSSSSSTSSRNMWIYKQTTVRVPTTTAVTYTVQASDLTHVQGEKTAQLQYSLLADGAAAALPNGAAYSFQPVNDINGIIASISNTGLITFNQVSGSCYVKIACTMAEGTAYKYVKVTTEVDTPVCDHSYTAVTVDPTCTEAGYTTYTCTACGESYVADQVDALGHSYEASVTKEPTCSEEGTKTYTCTACGDSYTEAIATVGHTYESVVTAPTCTEQGYTTHTCTACGDVTVDSYVEPAHDFVSKQYEPTCSQDGFVKHTCTLCGHIEYTDIVDAFGHNYVHTVENGYNVYTCTGCGHSYTDEVVLTYNRVTKITEGETYVVTLYLNGKYYALSHAGNKVSVVEVVKVNNWIDSEVTEDLLWTYAGKKLSYESNGETYNLYTTGNNKDLDVSTTKASAISLSGTKLKIGSYYVRYNNGRVYASRTAGAAHMFQEG